MFHEVAYPNNIPHQQEGKSKWTYRATNHRFLPKQDQKSLGQCLGG